MNQREEIQKTCSTTDTLLLFVPAPRNTQNVANKRQNRNSKSFGKWVCTFQRTFESNRKESLNEFDALLATQKKRRRTCRRASNRSQNRRSIWVALFLHGPSGYYRRWQHQKSVSIPMENEEEILTSLRSGNFESATNVSRESLLRLFFLSFFRYKRSPSIPSRRREQFSVTISWHFFSVYV